MKIAKSGEWNAAAREEGVCRDFCAKEGEGERDGREGSVALFLTFVSDLVKPYSDIGNWMTCQTESTHFR